MTSKQSADHALEVSLADSREPGQKAQGLGGLSCRLTGARASPTLCGFFKDTQENATGPLDPIIFLKYCYYMNITETSF